MTHLQIWDMIRMRIPEMREPVFIALFNEAENDLNYRAQVYKKRASLTLTTALTYDLPSDFVALLDIWVQDSNSVDLPYALDWEVRRAADGTYDIYFTDRQTPESTTLPGDVNSISIEYIAAPTAAAAAFTTSSPSVPAKYHKLLEYYILARMAVPPGPDGEPWELKYERGIREARRWENEVHDFSPRRSARGVL